MKKQTTKLIPLFATSLSLLLTSTVFADDVRREAVCAKVKACAIESFSGEEIPEKMKETLMSQLDVQCAKSFSDEKEQQIIDAGLTKEANACADEMIDMPCGQLMSVNGASNSKACLEFQEASEKAGIEEG